MHETFSFNKNQEPTYSFPLTTNSTWSQNPHDRSCLTIILIILPLKTWTFTPLSISSALLSLKKSREHKYFLACFLSSRRFIFNTQNLLHTKGRIVTVGSKKPFLRLKNTEGPLLPIPQTYPTNPTHDISLSTHTLSKNPNFLSLTALTNYNKNSKSTNFNH